MPNKMLSSCLKPLAFAAVIGLLAPSGARAQEVQAAYRITLAGLSIGAASLRARIANQKYDLALSAKLTGLVGAVAGGTGSATAAGGIGQTQPMPASYALRTSDGKKTRTVRIAMTGGNVQATEILPPIENQDEAGAARVPIVANHKRAVVDPVSALIMPMKANALDASACSRTIPVFDGSARYDIALSFKEIRNVADEGYSGPVIVCAARYVPVAGHRPDRKSVKFMTENRDIETWLAPVDGARVLIPYRISVKTQIGMTIIQAARFSVAPTEANAQRRTN